MTNTKIGRKITITSTKLRDIDDLKNEVIAEFSSCTKTTVQFVQN